MSETRLYQQVPIQIWSSAKQVENVISPSQLPSDYTAGCESKKMPQHVRSGKYYSRPTGFPRLDDSQEKQWIAASTMVR